MITITRHKNHKLYVSAINRYTNLTEIKELVQSGEKVTVIDYTNGDDITAFILAQILVKTGKVPADKIAELIRKGL